MPLRASVIFSGESKDPDEVARQIHEEIAYEQEKGVDPVAFERAKKAMYGRNVASLNSAENIANSMVSLSFAGRELFSYLDAIANAGIEQVNTILRTQLNQDACSLSVVNPLKSGKENVNE